MKMNLLFRDLQWLLSAVILLTCLHNCYSKHHMPHKKAVKFEQPDKRASIPLPTLGTLFDGKMNNGTRFDYQGCNIVLVQHGTIKLDLRDSRCQDVMSIPRLYQNLTGDNSLDSLHFLPLKRFNVEEITLNLANKEVSIKSIGKEPFPLFRGTRVRVKQAELTITFTHGTETVNFENLGFSLNGEVPMGEQSFMSLSLWKNKTSQMGEFTLEADAVKVGDFFNTFTKGDIGGADNVQDLDTNVFTSMVAGISLSYPKIEGTRDASGNSEVVVSAPSTDTSKKISCETYVDVFFVVDSSLSVRQDYDKEKQFLKSLATAFHLETRGVRVGVITFSHKPVLNIKLNQCNDTSSFDTAVDNIPMIKSFTKIDKGLRLAEKELFDVQNGARVGLPKLIVLITDGVQSGQRGEDPAFVSAELRKKGINMVIIGIGKKINVTELVEIAGDKNKTYNAQSFKELVSEQFMETASKAMCSESAPGKLMDDAFDKISISRDGKKGKITVMLSNGTVATGEIIENGNIHTGFVNFPNGRKHNFWYYSLESTIYWDSDKGGTTHVWKGKQTDGGDSIQFQGLQKGDFYIITQITRGRPAEAGIIVKYGQIKPASVVSRLLNKNIGKIPILNDVTTDVVVEYANADMGAPTENEVAKLLKDFSPTPGIEEGTNIKFVVSLKKLVEINSAIVESTNINLEQHIRVDIISTSNLTFQFLDATPFNMEDFLAALNVDYSAAGFKKIFLVKILVRVSSFEVNVITGVVDIKLESSEPVSIGDDVLVLEKATINVIRDGNGTWLFSLSSNLALVEGTLRLEVTKKEEEYMFRGTTGQADISDLIQQFNVTKTARGVLETIPSLKVEIKNLVITAQFEGKMELRLSGWASFMKWTSTLFEGVLVANEEYGYDLTFGLVLRDTSINDLATEIYSSSGKQMELFKASWLSKLTITIIVGSASGIDFRTAELKKMAENKTYMSSVTSKKDVAYIFAVAVIPGDCNGDTVCEYIKRGYSVGNNIEVGGAICEKEITLKADLSMELKLSEKLFLKEISLSIKVGDETEYSLTGTSEVEFQNLKMSFKARLKQEVSGRFALTFSMAGMWQSPFSIRYLQFASFEMSAGVNFVTLQQPFALSGEMRFGYPGTALKAQLTGGFQVDDAPGFYFYAKFTTVSIKAIFEAFNIQKDLPKPVVDMEFPDGLLAGISYPKGRRIDIFNVDLKPGFVLQGESKLLGVNMYCQMEIDLPKTFRLKAEFSSTKFAGGAIEFSGIDQQGGPSLDIVLGDKFQITIDAYVEVLKIGTGARISISENGLQFELVGRFLDLFEAKMDITAPYGSLVTLPSSQWKIETCISDLVKEKIVLGATDNVQECSNATMEAQREYSKVKGESDTWFNKAMEKVSYWKQKLLEKEKKFQEEIQKIENQKKDLDQSCVAKCDKRKVWVGGFGEKTCVVAGKNVQCPYWIEEKTLRDDPLCLADCEAGRFKIFSKIGGFFKSGDLLIMEEKMAFYSKMLDKVQSFVMSSKYLIEIAETASKKVREMVSVAGDALAAIRSYTLKNLFYLDHLCMSATLEHGGRGLCFKIDVGFYLGGKNGKNLHMKENVCFNLNWASTIGKMIANTAFPGLDTIKEKFRQTKDLLSKNEKQSEDIQKESDEIQKRDYCDNDDNTSDNENRCWEASVHKKLSHYRSRDILDSLPDTLVRNDESMQSFRDLFDNEPDRITRSPVTDVDTMVNGKLVNGIDSDDDTPSPGPQDNCRRASNVMTTYGGILESINLLLAKNNNVKRSYERFIGDYQDTFDALEKKIHNDSTTENMSAEETENALFYVNKAKQGIAKWKMNYDVQFESLDKSSLGRWRNLMSGFLANRKLNINSYPNLFGSAGSPGKRVEVPDDVKQQLKRSLTTAEKIVHNLLQADDDSFSSKSATIKTLVQEVNNLNFIKKQLNC